MDSFRFLFWSGIRGCIRLLLSEQRLAELDHALNQPDSLASHLQAPSTFYRAVTRTEVARIDNYPTGQSPQDYWHGSGNFSFDGALYVFADRRAAMKWGEAYNSFLPVEPYWYLVEFAYTPNNALNIKSFSTGTDEWKQFVNNCYMSTGRHQHDIVEGPLSIAGGPRRRPYLEGGYMVYQAAFVGPQALGTLVVEEVTRIQNRKSWAALIRSLLLLL